MENEDLDKTEIANKIIIKLLIITTAILCTVAFITFSDYVKSSNKRLKDVNIDRITQTESLKEQNNKLAKELGVDINDFK